MKKQNFLFIAFIFLFVTMLFSVYAWQLNGTIYDPNNNPLNNATINVTIYPGGNLSYNSTYSNASGYFNLNVTDNSSWLYTISIIHYQDNVSNYPDYIDQVLQYLPWQLVSGNVSTNFYLKPAGALNINAQGPISQNVNEIGYLNGTNYTIFNANKSGFGQLFVSAVYNASNGSLISQNYYSVTPSGILYKNNLSTANWSSVNISYSYRSQNATSFNYAVSDISTGFQVSSDFVNYYFNKTVYVPADGNYSIQIFPFGGLPPVSFQWNNFSSQSDLNITLANSANSTYNATTKTLNKMFNTSINFGVMINGYALNTTGNANFTNFTIIPYVLQPAPGFGNEISSGNPMPYNMSSWNIVNGHPGSDLFNTTTGFYNMTIPGPAEGQYMLLFAVANSSSGWYGGFVNVSLNYSSSNTQINFTLYPMMGNSSQGISMSNNPAGGNINITVPEQPFNIINSTGSSITSGLWAMISVDYSNFNATNFTFMINPSGTFYVPLINTTGVTSINIYSQSYAPEVLTSLNTPALISSNNNITLSQFTPGQGVNNQTLPTNVQMQLLKSNSTCDVPNPPGSCILLSSTQNTGNPLSAIIGGGKVSFQMGLLSSGVIVDYVNVNMLASGPPSIMFDASTSNSTSGGFSSAMRFGSLGPKIYDYAMISIPYSTSQLVDSSPVNVSVPLFYLDNASGLMDWRNPIWNTTQNGTNSSLLSGNYSHFSGDTSAWQTLMSGTTCVTNQSLMNSTNPCYLDTTNQRVWLRIPHFSGIDPSITGTAVVATASTTTSSGGGGGGSSSSSTGVSSNILVDITPGTPITMNNTDSSIGIQGIQINVNNEAKNVQVTITKYDTKPVGVSVEKTGQVYQYIHIDTTNLSSYLANATIIFRVNKSWVSNNVLDKDNVSIYKFNETSTEWKELPTSYKSEDSTFYYYNVQVDSFSYFAISEKSTALLTEVATNNQPTATKSKNSTIYYVLGVIVLLLILLFFRLARKRR